MKIGHPADLEGVKLSFYIYENWTAENKARIHRAGCAFCNNGQGIHPQKEEGRNGMWHGPYATYAEARRAAGRLQGRALSNCRKCQPS